MIITETKIKRRPSTDIDFFNQATSQPIMQAWYATVQPYIDSGDFSEAISVSDDGLEQTTVHTFNGFAVYSNVDTTISLAMNNEYLTYSRLFNFIELDHAQVENRRATYTQTGINQPFTVTTTYTFPEVAPEDYSPTQLLAVFANAVESYAPGLTKKKNLILDENTVIIIHQYDNSADFTDNIYNDLFFVPQLAEKGVTRTIQYALV